VKLPGEFGAWVCDCLDNADKADKIGTAGERNAAFIAAANPATILAMIERLQVAEDAAKRYLYLRNDAMTGTRHDPAVLLDGPSDCCTFAFGDELDLIIDAAIAAQVKP
jgi:hypothetical protein